MMISSLATVPLGFVACMHERKISGDWNGYLGNGRRGAADVSCTVHELL